ncbi:hypothetical protein KDL01_18925 [Actinospica durhamensis]|uniref:DUF1877 family protein n=1 Tax=Actinospica durhamensis TaxID=1508375 RepID=A0A941EMW4_9ACTN|nr:hypothetical protein [Actinospica durhamensis]MBR7835355.1 hypothetical protein [Actinospica durhamensis]
MSVLHDYFRAPDPSTAIDWAVGPGGDWHQHGGLDDYGADWIDAKNLDPFVVLGQLIAFARAVPFDARSTSTALLWPDEQAWPYGVQRPGRESPWDEGLTLVRLPEEWVTALAEISDEQMPRLALRWKDIEEIRFAEAADAEGYIEVFRALARRARDHGQGLYCKSVV